MGHAWCPAQGPRLASVSHADQTETGPGGPVRPRTLSPAGGATLRGHGPRPERTAFSFYRGPPSRTRRIVMSYLCLRRLVATVSCIAVCGMLLAVVPKPAYAKDPARGVVRTFAVKLWWVGLRKQSKQDDWMKPRASPSVRAQNSPQQAETGRNRSSSRPLEHPKSPHSQPQSNFRTDTG